jgi:WD40 repeat protein/serine/threonine protein kinase
VLNCSRCGADYSEQGLDGGRCRQCGNVITWSMSAVPSATLYPMVSQPQAVMAAESAGNSLANQWADDFATASPDSEGAAERRPESESSSDDASSRQESLPREEEFFGRLHPPDDGFAVRPLDGAASAFGGGLRPPRHDAPTPPLRSQTVKEYQGLNPESIDKTVDALWSVHIRGSNDNSFTVKTAGVDQTIPDHLVIPRRAVRGVIEGQGMRNDYELIEVIGVGGEGVVHAARQASIDRTVALKMIRQDRLDAGDAGEGRLKFLSEAVVTGALEHPNIVPIYDLGTTNDGTLFYVMKRVVGTPWSEVIRSKALHENIAILMRVADAVALAHSRGVVHRDLKPENVMLGDFGEVLLTDWGIALCTEDFAKKKSVMLSRGLGGTPAYMAPEMATGPIEAIGPAADIYLLGAILFEITTGKPPHHADDVLECLKCAARNDIQATDVSGELLDIARRAMLTNPAARFESVKTFQDSIAGYLSHSESVLLSEQANEDLKKARQSGAYQDFAASVFGFQKALDLWADNVRARSTLVVARSEYASAALKKGDLDLSLSLLDAKQPRHVGLIKQIVAAQKERDARQNRLRSLRRLAAGLLVAIFAGGTYAFMRVSEAKRQSDISKQDAEDSALEAREQAALAEKQSAAAIEAQLAAKKSADEAEAAALRANEERKKSDIARAAATDALRRAREASYASAISLAINSIATNAFDDAVGILKFQQTQAEQSPLRHWEWGRLMYLGLGGDPASHNGTAVQTVQSDSELMAVAVSPDRNRIASPTMAGEIHLWTRQGDSVPSRWDQYAVIPGNVLLHDVAFSPDGNLLAAGGDDDVIRLYDLRNLELEPILIRGHRGPVFSVAFAPIAGPPVLASASADRTIKLWSGDWAEPINTLVGHTATVWSVAFDGKGERLVTASDDFTARVWGVQSGKELQRFRRHGEPVFCAEFSPDGKWVASGGYDKRVLIWAADRFQPIESTLVEEVTNRLRDGESDLGDHSARDLIGHSASVRSVAFSDDGRFLASGARDNTVRIWDLAETAQTISKPSTRLASAKAISDSSRQSVVTQRTLRGHGGWISDCQFLDSEEVVSVSLDQKLKIWRPALYQETTTLEDIRNPVLSATYSPDGRLAVLGFDDGTAGVWNTTTGERIAVLNEGHDFLASNAIFLPGGKRMVTIAGDDTLRMWEVDAGTEVWSTEGTGRRGLVAVSPDGKLIVTGSSGGKVAQVWDAETGASVRALDDGKLDDLARQYPLASPEELQKQVADITALTFSTDGSLVVTGDSAGTCSLWDVGKSEPVRTFRGHERAISAIHWNAGDSSLITASADGTVAFWDTQTGRELPGTRLIHEDSVSLMAISGDESSALTVAADRRGSQKLYYWRLADRTLIATYSDANGLAFAGDSETDRSLAARSLSINSVAFAPDRNEALVALFDTKTSRYDVRKWDLQSGSLQPLENRELRPGLVFSAIYARAAAQQVLTVGGSGARFWDRDAGREVMNYRPHGAIFSVDVSDDNESILTTGADRSIKVWQYDPGNDRWVPRAKLIGGHAGPIRVARFAGGAANPAFLSGGEDGRVVVWERAENQWKATGELAGHEGAVLAIDISSDGRFAATSSQDQSIRIWDLTERVELAKLLRHRGAVLSVRFSQDGRRLISGGSDNVAMIWDWRAAISDANLAPSAILVGHSAAVNAVAFSPDGMRALTGSQDNTLKLWDSGTRSTRDDNEEKELMSLTAHQREVTAVDFSSDGKQILSAGRDRQAILWNSIDVEPAILIDQNSVSYSPGARPIELLKDVKIKHPTQQRIGGYRVVFSVDHPEGIRGEAIGLDSSSVSGLGWEIVGDQITGEGRVIAKWSDAAVGGERAVEDSSTAQASHRFEITVGPDVVPAEVEKVLSMVTYRCDIDRSRSGSDDLPVLEVRIDLVPAGDGPAVASQIITVQLVDEDSDKG